MDDRNEGRFSVPIRRFLKAGLTSCLGKQHHIISQGFSDPAHSQKCVLSPVFPTVNQRMESQRNQRHWGGPSLPRELLL